MVVAIDAASCLRPALWLPAGAPPRVKCPAQVFWKWIPALGKQVKKLGKQVKRLRVQFKALTLPLPGCWASSSCTLASSAFLLELWLPVQQRSFALSLIRVGSAGSITPCQAQLPHTCRRRPCALSCQY